MGWGEYFWNGAWLLTLYFGVMYLLSGVDEQFNKMEAELQEICRALDDICARLPSRGAARGSRMVSDRAVSLPRVTEASDGPPGIAGGGPKDARRADFGIPKGKRLTDWAGTESIRDPHQHAKYGQFRLAPEIPFSCTGRYLGVTRQDKSGGEPRGYRGATGTQRSGLGLLTL